MRLYLVPGILRNDNPMERNVGCDPLSFTPSTCDLIRRPSKYFDDLFLSECLRDYKVEWTLDNC